MEKSKPKPTETVDESLLPPETDVKNPSPPEFLPAGYQPKVKGRPKLDLMLDDSFMEPI